MSTDSQLPEVIRELVEVIMRRSMHSVIRFVKAADLNMGQYSVLMHLHHAEHCGVSDVASHLDVTTAAASQLVDRLVHQGLVERTEDAHDRRAKRLSLTPYGRQFIERSIEARTGWTRDLAPYLSPDREAAVIVALQNLVGAVRALSDEHEKA